MLSMPTTKLTAAETAQTIAARLGGRVVDDGHYGYRVALNDKCGTYVCRVTALGEILKFSGHDRIISCPARISDF